MTIENAVNSVGNLFDTYKLNDTITLKKPYFDGAINALYG